MAPLCVPILFLVFFFLHETHGTSTEKSKKQVSTFRIEFTGKITKDRYDLPSKPANILTKLTLFKDGKEVAKTHVNWIGGKYKLVADIPENEKSGDYKLVASSPGYHDKDTTFDVSSDHESPFIRTWNATIKDVLIKEKV
ncbi:hypothetical protein Ddc_22552 [Ditylenchus destructor]|nr:hypothetical protein Ddc_22552 [Ditylenchus destructor]